MAFFLIGSVVFPVDLLVYGLNEDLLMKVFHQMQNEEYPLAWYIRGIPDYGFYQDLHQFIEMSHPTQKFTKVSIGKFYMSIDLI